MVMILRHGNDGNAQPVVVIDDALAES